ncbi:hypothetical protein AMATHDRAFT_135603 [Amanita thiersii Skay4041]|uniref:HORMA domain-containing protein n=1 Tax=Amanita thiersii Skay4041 TaxID=703135 RepID=A0A2A9P0X1_9AGAR|nr:hypothetical protein AMATHDRAFT_135603 [Amanita thiersii Skay4041]
MQAQDVRTQTQAITSSQSLAAIQTLLRAGLGCITFLRNLLPDENFTESHFTTNENVPDHSPDSSISSFDHERKRQISGFKIMTMTRGYTEEADRILNYLEHGIFDALHKQYLRSFIFAIYLDSKDPNNIVEAYTFNFHYHTIPGTNSVVPILSLGEDLQKMSLRGQNQRNEDPVTSAILKGRVPTLKEVKRSVKALLKTLIHAMTQMDLLPKRRYATFKLFYTDNTPSDYEPPYFQTGDVEKDKWYFMTHDLDEVPDKWSVGRVNTGHHSVNLSVTSITAYLPSSTVLDNATFEGVTSQHSSTSPEQEVHLRIKQIKDQDIDAETRNIAWSVEDCVELTDLDAEGEDDPDYVALPDGSCVQTVASCKTETVAPVGLRDKNGAIKPLPMDIDEEACFGGICEIVPSKLADLVSARISRTDIVVSAVDQTQTIDDPAQKVLEQPDYNDSGLILSVNGDLLKSLVDNGLECECGVKMEDACCFCEGGCRRWYHLWYHSIKDSRMPAKFICFDCRLRGDLSWELVKIDLYPKLLSKFKELATFRRAIKVAELKKPTTLTEFAKYFGFIYDQSTIHDKIDLMEARSTRTNRNRPKNKNKVVKRKNLQNKYSFNPAAKSSQAYMDYFDPNRDVESRLLGLPEMDCESERPKKKMKISVAVGVDLAE